MLTDDAKSH